VNTAYQSGTFCDMSATLSSTQSYVVLFF